MEMARLLPAIVMKGTDPRRLHQTRTPIFVKPEDVVDTNENTADFLAGPPNPRNTGSPVGECKPEITINDVAVAEETPGQLMPPFTVMLSTASATPSLVNYATTDDTAIAPADYQATSGVLTFNPGDLTKTITVPVNGDTLDEPNETFFLNLSNATKWQPDRQPGTRNHY